MAISDIKKARLNRDPNKLGDRQQRFVIEYLKEPNAALAARKAGYNTARANQQGYRLLKLEKVRAAIKAGQAEQREKAGVSVESISQMLIEDRKLARKNGQTAAAVQAAMGLAKLHGMLTDNVNMRGGLTLDTLMDQITPTRGLPGDRADVNGHMNGHANGHSVNGFGDEDKDEDGFVE